MKRVEQGGAGLQQPGHNSTILGAIPQANWGAKGWRDQLQRLEPLDLPLLGVGADKPGERGKRKAPASLRDGSLLKGWPTAKHTWQQINNACTKVIACGTRTGKAAHGLVVFDVDGATAVSWCLERGCDPADTRTWQIHRNTDESRLKVAFRLTAEQQQELGQAKRKHVTKAATNDREKSEAVELFHQGGSQVIVLGQHWESKGHYFWPDGMGPEDLAPIPECWWKAALEIIGVNGKSTPSPAPLLQALATELPPRSEADLLKALERVPEFRHDQGRRDELLGLAMRLTVEWGADAARAWLAQHSPTITDLAGYFTTAPTQISPGSIWPFLHEHYGISLKRHDLKRSDGKKAAARKVQPKAASVDGKAIRLTPAQVMQRLPEEVGLLRLNTRSQDVTVGGVVMTGNAIARLYLQLSNGAETWPKEATYDAAMLLAEQNSFDPVADYLNTNSAEALPMEQWKRLDRHLLGIDDPIAATFLPRYLIAAVARTLDAGCDFRQTPVLVGDQWLGKTAAGRILFSPQHFISGVGDLGKDALERCHTAWGVELAELDGITRRSDQEALKAFLSETCDSWRSPYGRATERRPRRFLFWGTSNGAALKDTTGNTRFVCIPVKKPLPLEWIEQNRDAIWSRAVEQYRAGVGWQECCSVERSAIADRNDNYQQQDPWLPVVQQLLERSAANQQLPVQVPDLLTGIGVPRERQGTKEAKRVQQLAESLGWQQDRRRVGGKRQKGLWPPATAPGHTTGHTGHTTGHTTATPPNPNAHNGSAPLATPATPTPKELDTEGEKQERDRSSRGCVQALHRQVGVAGVVRGPEPSHSNGSGGVASGVAGVARGRGGVASTRTTATPAPATIPGFIDPTPAPIGSGADVMGDGDDPTWAKRPEAAA